MNFKIIYPELKIYNHSKLADKLFDQGFQGVRKQKKPEKNHVLS